MAWKNADRESRAGEETRRFMLTKRGSPSKSRGKKAKRRR